MSRANELKFAGTADVPPPGSREPAWEAPCVDCAGQGYDGEYGCCVTCAGTGRVTLIQVGRIALHAMLLLAPIGTLIVLALAVTP